MSRIFLSHSSQDNFAAIALRDWLKTEGWDDVFLDLDPERGIVAGERWERKLHEASSRCEAVVFLVSGHWLASDWCLKEYNLARGLNKKLFAVLIDPDKTIKDLPPTLTGTWQVVDLAHRQDMQIFRVPDPDSHEEEHVTFSREGLRRLKAGLERAGLDPKFFAWPPGNEPDRAPYRGLQALDAADAGIFFGRDAPIIAFSDALRGLRAATPARLLVILGASGSGKSSFLRAGLLPRLGRDDANFLTLPPIRPERAALTGENGLLAALEAACPDRTRAELRAAIKDGAAGVRPLLAELAEKAFRQTLAEAESGKPPSIVIAIDQAEELFRPDGAEEGAALLALLRDLTRTDEPSVIAIFAIRSDSYDALQNAKPLEDLQQKPLSLPPMPHNAYREVVEEPAKRVVEAGGKLAIEPQLIDRLLEDIELGGGKDALPLLAFTLEQLYREYGRAGALRLQDYEAFGGLKGTIDAAVERAFARADRDSRIPRDRAAREALLRRGLIPWLAGVDPDSKSPRRNIARRSDIPAEAVPLIDLLIEERLISTDTVLEKDATGKEVRIATIEPAHEALLRQWGLLEGWLAEDFGLLATLEGVKRAARDWDANGRADAWLAHQGQRLAEAQGLDARPDIAARLDATDRAYLAQCRTREEAVRTEAEQRRREREAEQARRLADAQALAAANRRTAQRTGIGLLIAVVLAIAAAAFGVYAKNEKQVADAQRDRAQKTLALATETANGLVSDLAQKFRDVAGVPAKMIEDILDRVGRLQDQLLQSGQSSPDLLRSQADALMETATTLLTLGKTQSALAAAEKAGHILEALSEQPGNPGLQRDLSVSYNNIGNVQAAEGHLPEALQSYQASLNIGERLAKSNPSNASWQDDLAVSYINIGDIQIAQGHLPEALQSYQASLDIRARLVKSYPRSAPWHRNLSVSYERVGDAQVAERHLPEALQSYQTSQVIFERLVKIDPVDVTWQRDLAVSYNNIGNVLVAERRLPEALQSYQASLTIAERLATSDPGNAQWQRDLSVSYNEVGNVEVAQGHLPEALQTYETSLNIVGRLARSDPGNAGWQRDLIVCYVKIAGVDPSLARVMLTRAAGVADAMQSRGILAPKDAWMPGDLARRIAALPP
jgi:tetratricopeptide (TPR) repeat protein